MNATWQRMRDWLQRVSAFMDGQNASVRPNPYVWAIYRPAERESDELARLCAQHPGLGAEVARALAVADRAYLLWAEKPDDAGWVSVLNGAFDLQGQLTRTVEALDGPLNAPPPVVLAQLTPKSCELLTYLWHHSGVHFRELCDAMGWGDESSARRAVTRLADSLLELGEPDLVRVQNARVWVQNRDF